MHAVMLCYHVCGGTVTAYVATAFRKLYKTFFRLLKESKQH